MRKDEIKVADKGIRDILEAMLKCNGYGSVLTPLSIRRLCDYIHELESKNERTTRNGDERKA